MRNRLFSIVSVLLLAAGCAEDIDVREPLPGAVALDIDVCSKSVAASSAHAQLNADLIRNLNVWVYICDAEGNVSLQTPVAHTYVDLEESGTGASDHAEAKMPLSSSSRYYMVVAGSNYSTIFLQPDATFKMISTSKSVGTPQTERSAGWTVIDVLDADAEGKVKAEMELFSTPGKVSILMAKSSYAMRLLIDKVVLCSTSAPTGGAALSAMTVDQIYGNGWEGAQWWFDGTALTYAPYSRTIASGVSVEQTGTYLDVGSLLVFENPEGWTNLASFREEGFSNVPQGNGYYLDITYRYATVPGADLGDAGAEGVVTVRKYVPLPPVRRSNHYVYRVMVDLNDVIVSGMTEVSEEIPGEW